MSHTEKYLVTSATGNTGYQLLNDANTGASLIRLRTPGCCG